MKKFAFPALLALAFLIQLSLPLATVIEKESTENSGLLVRIPVSLYDPFDPFRGRYLNLKLDLTGLEDEPYYLELPDAPLKYYLEENLATWSDAHLRDLFDESHSIVLEGRVFRGVFRPGELLIDGQTLGSFVEARNKSQ